MVKNKGRARAAGLSILERHGVRYITQEAAFHCRHCDVSISSPNVAHAKRHLTTKQHLLLQY